MTNALTKRRLAMVITLGITVWLAVQADDGNNDSIIQLAHSHQEAADRAKTSGASTALTLASDPASPGDSNALNWKALAGRTPSVDGEAAQSADLFKSHDWYVASKALEPPAPPPPPAAPNPPFSYLGKLENTPKGTTFFLSENNKVYAVVAGDNIDNVWPLDVETATSLTLTYLPLGQQQTLAKTSAPSAPAEDGNQGAF